MSLILGSQSPRRSEILSYFSIPFQQVSSHFDEDSIPFEGDPKSYVKALAEGKAKNLIHGYPQDVILTADTVVYKEGQIFGKPRDSEHAFEMLMTLSDSWHSVFSAIAVASHGRCLSGVEETRVRFVQLTEANAKTYHDELYCRDKAGGYAIQNAGSLIVQRIDGCYYNVMGLPIQLCEHMLQKVGYSLWNFLGVAEV